MYLISFELTMPNRGSWNGRWSGDDKKYFIIKKLTDRFVKSSEHLKELVSNGRDSWYYSWGDGWGANVTAEVINGTESRQRRKMTAGFCGYDWMVDSIITRGEILAKHQIKGEKA